MNIVKAIFSGGCTQITAAETLWQWDQGQILQIVGLDLPDAYQVEFSNQPVRGTAAPMIGGVDGVEIPDVYLTTGRDIYAFVVLHSGETDRETEYRITIHVNARPQPTDVQPTPEQQGVIDQLIAALNVGVQRAEDAADQAEAAVTCYPKIVDGTWWVFDAETETWADTGIRAEGLDGVGISGAVLNADYTLTLTFTDGTSYTTPSIRGAQGERGPIGPTPDISIGTVTTGAAGSQAEATMTGTPERPVLNLTIPRGDPGEVTQAEFDDLADEVSQQKSAIATKAGMLVDTVSGAIASFVPDSTIPDLLGVSVAVEPQQDLHGYDSPWPAGGGSNKIDITKHYTNGWTNSTNNITAAYNNGVFAISGTSNSSGWTNIVNDQFVFQNDGFVIPAGTYTAPAHCTFVINIAGTNTNKSGTFSLSESGTVIGFFISVAPNATTGWSIPLCLVTGSTAPSSYIPYSNICPISGWDAVEVNHSGSDTSNPNTYTIQLGQTVYGCKLTISEDGSVTALVDRALDTVDGSQNLGYNGTLSYGGVEVVYYPASAKKLATSSATQNEGLISDKFKTDSAYLRYPLYATGRATNGNIYFSMPEGITTAALAKTWFSNNPTQISYLLANPFEIQLDPVTIATIANQTNNVWSDAGDVSVTYAADIKAYIDRLNQPTEDDMIANSLIASGKYFTVNNRLFLSTASIAAGAQIIPGHNCTETSLVEALNALNA